MDNMMSTDDKLSESLAKLQQCAIDMVSNAASESEKNAVLFNIVLATGKIRRSSPADFIAEHPI